MLAAIEDAREEQDSVGGVIECAAVGLPAGIGSPMLDSVESRLASILFGVPAVKGVEFGAGFAFAALRGSHANDPFYEENGAVKTETNNNGGVLGGITSGMPLIVRACIKPTPSIGMAQDTLNLRTGKVEPLSIHGRHDPCIVTRAAPVIEAACAVALADLSEGGERLCVSLHAIRKDINSVDSAIRELFLLRMSLAHEVARDKGAVGR